jgi:hypothetical protein
MARAPAPDEEEKSPWLVARFVEPEVENPAEEAIRLGRVLHGLRVTADIIVASERDVEDWRDVRGSVIHAALSESRLLAA